MTIKNPASERGSQTLGAEFSLGVLKIVRVESFGVTENSGGFLKRHAVFLQVAQGFPGVPREHISVYTLIQEGCREEADKCGRPGHHIPQGLKPQLNQAANVGAPDRNRDRRRSAPSSTQK